MMSRQTSMPMRSARASGPIGWFMPSFMTVSIASRSATPSMRAKAASLIIGMRTRLLTKPGRSATTTGTLPSARARSTVSATVSSLVSRPRTISTSCMIGTGFMKCMPTKRAGRRVAAASSVTEIEEVFVARTAPGGSFWSSIWNTLFLRSRRSGTASTAIAHSASGNPASWVEMRRRVSSRALGSIVPLSTSRPRLFSMTPRPFLRAVSTGSTRRTCLPDAANTWAMPLPMVPAPATTTGRVAVAVGIKPPRRSTPPRSRLPDRASRGPTSPSGPASSRGGSSGCAPRSLRSGAQAPRRRPAR